MFRKLRYLHRTTIPTTNGIQENTLPATIDDSLSSNKKQSKYKKYFTKVFGIGIA